ncbi:ribulokinase [Pelagibius sp. Alg239-R121]|uniref:FGGY-family carbohydrate kinase n=1 Tax=Pelagibius sp. Alg239-R121 TaxID=2993448 RepID=UPI0024A6F07F|nr:FGGY-family carbohydrate kinase [Pelagibius sp. Alg239-R121]
MAGQYFIGIDGGTESLRAGVFDSGGTPLAFAATPYETKFPRPGQAEQNPADWWAAVGRSVRKAVSDSGISADDIAALCVDTTCCSVVALDENGDAVRPALIWMDVRAAKEADRVAGSGDPALRINSDGKGPVSAEWMIPKALWLKENEPGNFDRATTICEYQDYLNFHLTGRRVASINNVAVRWHYLSEHGGFQPSLLAKLGLDALLEKWPQEVLPLGEILGGLTAKASEHLGLPKGLPVAQGGADAFIAMIGLGVVKPGKMAFITGSSHLHLGLADHAFHGQGIWGTYADALLPGYHVVEGGQTSTGSIVAWLKRLLDPATTFDQLNEEAAGLPPGSDGLIVQDHFQGNRTPHTDPLSRGAVSGLTLSHGRGHLFRAILEGIAYGTELILETQRAGGYRPDELVIAGGVTNSDLWMQIHADVSGLPLTVTRVADAPALGCAILAATASGSFSSIAEASDAMVHVARRVEPDMAAHEAYRPFYEAYRRAYEANKTLLGPLTES